MKRRKENPMDEKAERKAETTEAETQLQADGDIFALDIGTRSIIGVVGRVEDQRLRVLSIEKENHNQRAMMDGQIENIEQVAAAARRVKERLERNTGLKLRRVCVAAAGRALKSERASFTLELPAVQRITDEIVIQLESGAVSEAEELISEQAAQQTDQYYMVGYTVISYRLDGYPISSIRDHSGRLLEAEVVATFLPREVVESLYAVVGKLNLEVASLTLEPIAALNAAIPGDIRLLNLVLVDIGAGTSDIAACRDGSVVGYTMATVAGDEVTEQLMRALLIDFNTAEQLKMSLDQKDAVTYTDIVGLVQEISPEKLLEVIEPVTATLAKELAARILELNGRVPSAVFLAGGGSKLHGLRELVAQELEMNPARVAVAGNHFDRSAFSENYDLNDPEYATPLGIAISAGLGLINDSYIILLNGVPAKLFRSGVLIMRDILMTNGYRYGDLMGKTGANLTFTLNGERKFLRGGLAKPPVILLNGEPAGLSDVVSAGDTVDFTPAQPGDDAVCTLAELLGEEFYGVLTVNGAPAELDYTVRAGDEIWAEARKKKTVPQGPPLRFRLNGRPLTLPPKESGEPYYLMDLLEFSGLDFQRLNKPVELLVNGEAGQFSQRIFDSDDVMIR